MAAASGQAKGMTRPLHLVLRCLYNADRKLSLMEIGQITQLSEPEVRAAVDLLQQHSRAETDQEGRVWLTAHNPDPLPNKRAPPSKSPQSPQMFDTIADSQWSDHSTIPFRAPPELPFHTSPDGVPRYPDEPLMGWRSELFRRPADAAELARIQRSVIETLRDLDAPPAVLHALERIAHLLEGPSGDSGR